MTDVRLDIGRSRAAPAMRRRAVLAAAMGLPLLGRATVGGPAPVAPLERATILIAGPEGGMLDRWTGILQPALERALPPETRIIRNPVGGPDGVTGANQFATRGEPDGQTVLFAPGAAVLAWLVGDPRAKYDVSRWLSVMACITPGVLLARPGVIAPRKDVRIPSAGLVSPDLAALLAIDLLGARAIPVPALAAEALPQALATGAIDAVFLTGHKVDAHAGTLIRAGAHPVVALGRRDESGGAVRCPPFLDVPTLPEVAAASPAALQDPALTMAWQATAVAAQLEFAMVLPHLTPAARVALWRQVAAETAGSLDVQATAMAAGARTIGGSEATATAAVTAADPAALVALRRWLTGRFNFRPG